MDIGINKETMKKTKKTFIFLYVILIIISAVFVLKVLYQEPEIAAIHKDNAYSHEFIHGEIQSINDLEGEDKELTVLANSGEEEKGNSITVLQSSINNFNTYEKGNEIQIYKSINNQTGDIKYEAADFYHQYGVYYMIIIFSAITILIARKKGVTAILSVLISLGLFYLIFLKMIGLDFSPLLACFIFIIIITLLTIPLIHGFNKKALSAIIAIFVGYLFSIAIAYYFRELSQLGNTPGEEFRLLGIMYPNINLSEILIASLFIGAVGALIDTAISISSAIFEAIEEKTAHTFKKVYKIGMEVGKDILGSMINTLLFAYIAASLPFLILISLSQGSTLSEFINMDFIALELTRTFIGAISLVIIIPIVASVSAYLLTKFERA